MRTAGIFGIGLGLAIICLIKFWPAPNEIALVSSLPSLNVKPSLSPSAPISVKPLVAEPQIEAGAAAAFVPLPNEFKEYADLKQKVIRSANQQTAWDRRLTHPGTRRAAVDRLKDNLNQDNRMTAVEYLLEGLNSVDPQIKTAFISSAEQVILDADLTSGTATQRRERSADVGELAIGLAIASPDSVRVLLERTNGTKRTVIDRALRYLERTTREVAQMHEQQKAKAK